MRFKLTSKISRFSLLQGLILIASCSLQLLGMTPAHAQAQTQWLNLSGDLIKRCSLQQVGPQCDFHAQNLSVFSGAVPADVFKNKDLSRSSFFGWGTAISGSAASPKCLNFDGAVLAGADFRGANLRCFSFIGADLRGADFSYANLASTTLRGANVMGANFSGADLSGSDLEKALNILAGIGGILQSTTPVVNGPGIKSLPFHVGGGTCIQILPSGSLVKSRTSANTCGPFNPQSVNAEIAKINTGIRTALGLMTKEDSEAVVWTPTDNTKALPAGAVTVGSPPCRVVSNGAVALGKVIGNNCNYASGGREVVSGSYQVLVPNPKSFLEKADDLLTWRPAVNGAVPPGAYNAGLASGPVERICRAENFNPASFGSYRSADGNLYPVQIPASSELNAGQVVGDRCKFGWGGVEKLANTFDVLVVDANTMKGLLPALTRSANEPTLASQPTPKAQRPSTEAARLSVYRINHVLLDDKTELLKVGPGEWRQVNHGDAYANMPRDPLLREVSREDGVITLYAEGVTREWESQYCEDKRARYGRSWVEKPTLKGYTSWQINLGDPNLAGTGQAWQDGLDPERVNGFGQPCNEIENQYRRAKEKSQNPYLYFGNSPKIKEVAMASARLVKTLYFLPRNPSQVTSFFPGSGGAVALRKGPDGTFVGPVFQRGAKGPVEDHDDWESTGYAAQTQNINGREYLALQRVIRNPAGSWIVHAMRIDIAGRSVWEAVSTVSQMPATDAAARESDALSGMPGKAWADAYELLNASDFDGTNVGNVYISTKAFGNIQWTLREGNDNQLGTYRWEEVLPNLTATQSNKDGNAVGPLVSMYARNNSRLRLKSDKLGDIEINWITGEVCRGYCLTAGLRRGEVIGSVLFGENEYAGQRKGKKTQGAPGVAPGFQVYNETDWPVFISINQVGCLYYGIVPPGQTRSWNTGSVWFELKATWKLDSADYTRDEMLYNCVLPVETAVFTALLAGATAGSSAPLSTSLALASASATTTGAVAASQSFMTAKGASQSDQTMVAAALYVVGGAAGGGITGYAMTTGKVATNVATSAIKGGLKAAASQGALAMGETVLRDASPQDLEDLNKLFTGGADSLPVKTLAGQYAGHAWPWKMKDRVMPTYKVSGGPVKTNTSDGGYTIRKGTAPFTFVKIN